MNSPRPMNNRTCAGGWNGGDGGIFMVYAMRHEWCVVGARRTVPLPNNHPGPRALSSLRRHVGLD
uniref:hypothetical protein n=1 Tax=Candidatus Electrothrix sp. TaxID=2170559 RepID=UPI00405771BF